jgi:hypothetical protein
MKKCTISSGKCKITLRFSSPQSEWLSSGKQTMNSGEDVRKKEPLCTAGKNVD